MAVEPTTVHPRDGRRLARIGLAAALVSRVFSRLVGVVLVVVLARQGDPVTVAVYGYLLGTSSLVIGLTSVGVAGIGSREVAAGRMGPGAALHAALVPQAASLGVAAVLTVALTLTYGPAGVPTVALTLTVACVLVGGFNGLFAELLRGGGRVVLEAALQMAASVGLVIGGVAVVHRGGDATGLLVVVLVKEFALLAAGVALIRPRRLPGVGARDLLRQSIWVALAGTALICLWRHGMVVVGATGGTAAVATYVVASRYLDAGVTLASTAGFGLRPGLSALVTDPVAFRRAVRRYLGLAASVGALVAVVGALAAGPLVTVPFGPRWSDAVGPVRGLALAAPAVLVTFVGLAALVARARTRWVLFGAVAGTGTGAGVSVLLVGGDPTALSPVLGTGAGASVVALMYLIGLRDLLAPVRESGGRSS
ncbi:MAG TPA: oligosaccharide flippase family protein [Pseudonocardia sp.]|nr:oligosaccharide flippase family protein [Pseudonocardia sp.]